MKKGSFINFCIRIGRGRYSLDYLLLLFNLPLHFLSYKDLLLVPKAFSQSMGILLLIFSPLFLSKLSAKYFNNLRAGEYLHYRVILNIRKYSLQLFRLVQESYEAQIKLRTAPLP